MNRDLTPYDDPDYVPIDPDALLPDQRALWDACQSDAPSRDGARVSRKFVDDAFRYACSLACTPLD